MSRRGPFPDGGSVGSDGLRIGVAIATANRPDIVGETVGQIFLQVRKADAILVCSPSVEDVEGLREAYPDVIHLVGPRGLPHQRNRLVEAAENLDILLFIDDDFIMDSNYIAETEAAFLSHPDLVLTTGRVVADGIIGPGFSFDEALARLSIPVAPAATRLTDVYNGYGCNMAIRLEPVRTNRLTFDEELPLYAWLEDVDFSRSLAPFGRIARVEHAIGVHLGVKSGRQRGVRLGYSQIANPCYLMSKGTCSWKKGLFHISRNLAANILGTLRGEKSIDRPGRLLGNLRAVADLVTQRLAPSRALRL
jgi:GT2 family glycosyltransferase